MYERHGHTRAKTRSATHYAWTNMIARCTNQKRPDYRYYGERGITVCARWLNSFAVFLADMGERPTPQHSIDRRDNTQGYSPNNCYWATKDQQMQNTRKTRRITFHGETMGLNAWAKRLGLNKESLRVRLNKWPLDEAMTRPSRTVHQKRAA